MATATKKEARKLTTSKPKSTQTKAAEKVSTSSSSDSTKASEKVAEKKTFKVKTYEPNELVEVLNGTHGKLIYISRRTGERYIWNEFGEIQDMEISELRNARNSNKDFFINNWFQFNDPGIPEYLGMSQYYKNALTIDEFDELFTKTPDEINTTISKLSEGQKKVVTYRAKQLISSGGIDSNKVIKALEDALGVELVER